MHEYPGVHTRFLRSEERFILSEEQEMPLVIEAQESSNLEFLQQFLVTHTKALIEDMSRYGAVLLRGFQVNTDKEFEETVLKISEFRGISEAFMAEHGRTHVDDLHYVLHTNSVYKTGGTLYLGGFHTENYYSADVPSYLCFCCHKPSLLGGETGIINTEKIYSKLSASLKQKLEKHSFFVGKWSLREIAERYQLSKEQIAQSCQSFGLPIQTEDTEQFVLMFKPSVLEHPINKKKALQINMFELPTLNKELRKVFMKDYSGKTWFWHRFFWKLPPFLFNTIELTAVMLISLFHSPKESYRILRSKLYNYKKSTKNSSLDNTRVGSCFNQEEVKELAKLMRNYYSSCLWQKGDILLIDNKKVMHAGMPGKGDRLVRALICNPIELSYAPSEAGSVLAKERTTEAIGAYLSSERRKVAAAPSLLGQDPTYKDLS